MYEGARAWWSKGFHCGVVKRKGSRGRRDQQSVRWGGGGAVGWLGGSRGRKRVAGRCMNIHDLTANPYTTTELCLHYCISNSADGSQSLDGQIHARSEYRRRDSQTFSTIASKHFDNLCHGHTTLCKQVYILYIRTGIQLSSVRPSYSYSPPSSRWSWCTQSRCSKSCLTLTTTTTFLLHSLPVSLSLSPSLSLSLSLSLTHTYIHPLSFCVTKTVSEF